jgi:hypothetical protein
VEGELGTVSGVEDQIKVAEDESKLHRIGFVYLPCNKKLKQINFLSVSYLITCLKTHSNIMTEGNRNLPLD